ncbi:MAG: hypothetical protein K2M73_04100 [Lachnospiraceae bacterium]|nr:hypothetical protein [Lachnospiraceae bacterium]
MKSIVELIKREKEPEHDKEYVNKLKSHKYKKLKRNLIIVAVIVIAFIGVYLYNLNKTYDDYSIDENILSGDTTKFKFYEYGEYYLRYSDDGLACMYGSETIWNQAFEMKQPLIDICKDYVAIAEQKTNTIYIFNKEGLQGKIETSYPIINIEVANQGVVAAITEEKDTNNIELIDKNGTLLARGQTVLSGDGCPIDISLSEDGTKLVVSYLYVSGGITQTRVVFYNYSEVGKNEVDRIVGGFNQYKTTIVPKVEFVTNDIAVAFGDDMLTIYSIKQKPSILKEFELEREVRSIFYNEKYIGLVFEPENLDNPYIANIYNLDGDIVFNGEITLEYNNIKIDGNNLLIYNDDTFIVQTVKGNEKFKKDIEENIKDVIGFEGGYTYILVTSESIDKIKLK